MNSAIKQILEESHSPCPGLGINGICSQKSKQECVWAPDKGCVPRGFFGADGELDEVEAIFVFSHPSTSKNEEYPDRDKHKSVNQVLGYSKKYLNGKSRTSFHGKIRKYFDYLWNNVPLGEQLRKALVTNSTMCFYNGKEDAVHEQCIQKYLLPLISKCKNAKIYAFGASKDRLKRHGIGFTDGESFFPW